jgi:type IV pilus assembly protein PilE
MDTTTARIRRPLNGPAPTGFTLIEVMVTVAIVAILGAVAMPLYTDYIRRGQLQEAFTNLSDYRVKLEQYYQDNKNYGATSGTTCATATTASTWNTFVPSDHKYFTYSCVTSSSGQAFVVTATGNSGQMTSGYVYTINQDGTKATTTYASQGVTASCWLSRGTTC